MEVKNIKVNDYSININNKYKSILEKNQHLLPTLNKVGLQFQLINSNEAFANSIRMVFNDELLVKYLDVSIFDLNTNDKYILPDNIIERIALIPLNQNVNSDKKYKLHIMNNSNDIIKIYSKELKTMNEDKSIDFNPNILLCTLKPNKSLTINNIKINQEYGFNNHIFSLGSFAYEIINTNFNTLSLNNNCTDFQLELIPNANIPLEDLVHKIYDNLYIRLKKIQNDINTYQLENHSNDISKILTDLFIIKNSNSNGTNQLYEIHIMHEFNNIGHLLTRYIYNLDNNIELINYKLEHPLRHKLIINIKHNQYKKLCNDAINNIIKDLNIFKTSIIQSLKK
jgi:DNA-directed RNA polymerase subunit L